MNDAAIISGIFGAYDEPKPTLPQTVLDVEWVLVTDDPDLRDGHLGWRVVYEPQPGVHPCLAAKRPKCLPWEYTTAQQSIWIDGSVRVQAAHFAVQALGFADPIAQFDHPERDCIAVEAQVSAGMPKYGSEPVLEQAARYAVLGHPEHWGLWATTVIARQHTAQVRELGCWWMAEMHDWSFQDQISQPFVLRELGLRPSLLPGYYRDNAWLKVEGSRLHQ
jgi:hypothetical protein